MKEGLSVSQQTKALRSSRAKSQCLAIKATQPLAWKQILISYSVCVAVDCFVFQLLKQFDQDFIRNPDYK